jgi:hypothetical protein
MKYLLSQAAMVVLAVVLTDFAEAGTFPDAHDPPTAGWTGPVFKLSQDYPTTKPSANPKPWKTFSFKTQPKQYIESVLAYCLEGNIQGNDPNHFFEVATNPVRKWYHAPWMHGTSSGREFVHGLTRERGSRGRELNPNKTVTAQNWAVGMYSAPGGYVIGQVWKDPNSPDVTKAKFPDGTVTFKLLFTDASALDVPYLNNSFTWQADINSTQSASSPRAIRDVRLLQVDVAVRDTRNSSLTGWVFGTFVYDGNAPGGTPLDRLVPVGLMWGNDPNVTEADPTATTHLTQTWINPNVGPPQHLGRAGRLNGPVDNPISSCLSCHSTAEYKAASDMVPASKTAANAMNWFRNVKATTAFDTGQQSLGYSLQLAVGIQRFLAAHPNATVVAPASASRMMRVHTVRRGEPDEP